MQGLGPGNGTLNSFPPVSFLLRIVTSSRKPSLTSRLGEDLFWAPLAPVLSPLWLPGLQLDPCVPLSAGQGVGCRDQVHARDGAWRPLSLASCLCWPRSASVFPWTWNRQLGPVEQPQRQGEGLQPPSPTSTGSGIDVASSRGPGAGRPQPAVEALFCRPPAAPRPGGCTSGSVRMPP